MAVRFGGTGSGGTGTSVSLQTNGVANSSQTVLNLVAGTNVTLTDGGSGAITIAASGSGSVTWDTIGAAAGSKTTANGNNTIVYNTAPTTNGQAAWTFGETSAATNGTGNTQVLLQVKTLASSTQAPFSVVARAGANPNLIVGQDGKVGIGITVPTFFLHIKDASTGTGSEMLHFSNADASASAGMGPDTSGALYGVALYQGGNQVFTVESNRGVLIGTANQSATGIADGLLVQGSTITGSAGAITTSATAPFLYINTCAGTPTGVPTNAATGAAPMIWDTTGKKFWIYDNLTTSWKGVVLA